MSASFQVEGLARVHAGGPVKHQLDPAPLLVITAPVEEHLELIAHAVDVYDASAHLEAAGFGDALARRHGALDVYDYAQSLPPSVGHSAPAIREASPSRTGWIKALMLLASASVMSLCAPAAAGQGLHLSVAVVASGLAGWILGQLVGAIAWRRAGLGDPAGAARHAIGLAAIVAFPVIAVVTVGTSLVSDTPSGATALLCGTWLVYVVSLTLVSVLGDIRPLAGLAIGSALISGIAALSAVPLVSVLCVPILSAGSAVLAVRAYLGISRSAPALPHPSDWRAAFAGALQAALMATALVLALTWSDADARIPFSVSTILAAAVCEPAVEDLGYRVRERARRSLRWREAVNASLLCTVGYLAVVPGVACGTAWAVALTVGDTDFDPGAVVPDALVLSVLAPVFAAFAICTCVVLRAGRTVEAIRISALACVGFAFLAMGIPAAIATVLLCGACLFAVMSALDTARHPLSW